MPNITNLHIELSTFCNAKCPNCTRTLEKNYPKIHLNFWEAVDKLDNSIIQNLKKIQLCGTYGDPILHPEFLEIIIWIRKNIPNSVIEISTNGEPHKEDWWEKLAKILDKNGYVIFGLDGLEETHSVYRVNTDFNTIIRNATAFINAGGRAHWQFVPFAHNEKDIIAALKLSKKLKFEKFFLKDERPSQDFKPWSKSKVSITDNKTVHPKDVCLFLQGTLYLQADGIFLPCCYMGNYNSDNKWKYSNIDTALLDNIKNE